MPLEALLTPDNLTYSASDGISGGTGCNYIFLLLLFLSPCSLSWPGRFTLRGRTWPKGVENYCRQTPRV